MQSGETVSYKASQQEAVPALRQAELRKLQAIDAIIRQTQACVQGSTTLEALVHCHQQSHQAMATLRKTFNQEISQLRDSYGLPKSSEPGNLRHDQPDQG